MFYYFYMLFNLKANQTFSKWTRNRSSRIYLSDYDCLTTDNNQRDGN